MSRAVVGSGVVLFLMLAVSACADDHPSKALLEPVVRAEAPLASDIVEAVPPRWLSSEGFFEALPSNTPHSADPDLALEVAVDLVSRLGPFFRPTLEAQAGRAIDIPRLEPVGRVYLAESPYESIPITEPLGLRAALGSYYIIPFGYDGESLVSVAVFRNSV